MRTFLIAIFVLFLFFITNIQATPHYLSSKQVIPASNLMGEYLPMLKGKKVGVISNPTSLVGNRHLVDTLISRKINVIRIFGPEHGFRGNAADGSLVENSIDKATGIPIISLYGNHKKPDSIDMQDIDIMVFDIQDVGCRFYTYISTLTYIMEACAENKVPLILLDRPNPNGYYIDGPSLEPKYTSFVGLHPVPIVYGMTIGEYANMINGEHWLKDSLRCNLRVIQCRNYTHETRYQLPVKPSPNLPNMKSVYLYPSLCLFEGTTVSVGRGTNQPFEIIGHPDYLAGLYSFIPKKIKGVSENPLYQDKQCFGLLLSNDAELLKQNGHIELSWLIDMYYALKDKGEFFNDHFDKLAGNEKLRTQIESGVSETQIRASWQKELLLFKKIRNKYLLYPDNQ